MFFCEFLDSAEAMGGDGMGAGAAAAGWGCGVWGVFAGGDSDASKLVLAFEFGEYEED